ncbi:hypothetical protein GGS20DRAFT_137003 [Poronia punctata]|nr:hypothetical protein GGS20DRAFT_137003 [Poronia punctata]
MICCAAYLQCMQLLSGLDRPHQTQNIPPDYHAKTWERCIPNDVTLRAKFLLVWLGFPIIMSLMLFRTKEKKGRLRLPICLTLLAAHLEHHAEKRVPRVTSTMQRGRTGVTNGCISMVLFHKSRGESIFYIYHLHPQYPSLPYPTRRRMVPLPCGAI